MPAWDVTAIGTLNIDLLITGDAVPHLDHLDTWSSAAQMEITAAGSIGYTACDLARLGLRVTLSSCISEDSLGTFLLDALRREGVHTEWIHLHSDSVGGIGVYVLLFGSSKRPLLYRLPTHEFWPLHFEAAEIARLLDTRLLHCGGYLHFADAWHGEMIGLFREAKQQGILTTLDPQFPLFRMSSPWLTVMDDLLPYVDVLLCDEDEARGLTGLDDLDEAALMLLDAGPQIVAIKQGAAGSTTYQIDRRHQESAVLLGEVVDTIGAGDAFNAAFILGTLEGWTLEERALFATIAAGFTVTGAGGTKAMPPRSQVEGEFARRR